MNVVVTSGAQHDTVFQIRPTTAVPPSDVVRLAMFRRGMTLRASTIPLEQRDALRAGEHPLGTTQVEHLAVTTQHFRHHAGIPRQSPQLTHGDRLVRTVDPTKPRAGCKVL